MISRERSLVWMIALVFVLGGVIGGGPVSPTLSMFVELPACFVAAFGVAGVIDGTYNSQAKPSLFLLIAICLAPLLQLIPFPATFWATLPSHNIPNAILELAGLSGNASPLSLAPEQTRLAALTLIVPAAVFVAAIQIDARGRDQLMLVIVSFAFLSAAVGSMQIAAGVRLDLGIYRQVHAGYPIGFFSNRNHEACLLLIAIPMCAHLIQCQSWPRRTRQIAMFAAVLALTLSVIATISRAGFVLLPVSLIGALAVWFWDGERGSRRIWMGSAGLVALSMIVLILLDLTPAGHRVMSRFGEAGDDSRTLFWKNTWVATKAFWPFGSGIGTFVPVYGMFEDLNSVNASWVNHAHNDYLEIVLETGVAGVLLFIAYIVILLRSLFYKIPRHLRRQRFVGIITIAILLGHSFVDYPMRTFALIAIFAFANSLLLPTFRISKQRTGDRSVFPPPSAFTAHL